jgi:hypothetical protein
MATLRRKPSSDSECGNRKVECMEGQADKCAYEWANEWPMTAPTNALKRKP